MCSMFFGLMALGWEAAFFRLAQSNAFMNRRGGRRALTFIIYLNDLDDGDTGGSTRFPALGLNVRPLKNAALVFENYDAHGNEDPRTLHSGEPPKSSAKYAMNVWVRTAPWAAFAIGAAQH
ncbi:hypothetical protein T492DRAFT_842820 [Pavlovales sp. CCMP2436]|nr:hypothetical protein T492DRAFT_842820 [Pavlovales sp. CCMP2436]